jgi:glutamyl-tRNA synthetase
MTVRTRFAPSPTGYLHIGGVRTALFCWLFARRNGGQFILRIDDTDQERNVEEALAPILHGLRWLGIDWDEGPEVGGPYAPYYQSQRGDRYRAAVERLLAVGAAYYDYATPEEQQAEREAAQREKRPFVASRRFMAETPAERARFQAEGRRGVVRLKMPRQCTLVIRDLVRGDVEIQWAGEQDHVVQRADGSCLYHLASVVDDHDFQITHVIRAEEHLSNTPRQIFIARSLGYDLPSYAHLPFVAEPGSKNKLSKRKLDKYLKNPDFAELMRHGRKVAEALGLHPNAETFNPVAVDFYEQVGYLPEALLNYLALLGWSLDDKTEDLSREQLISNFSLERVGRAAASFDPKKLRAVQERYMQRLPIAEKVARVVPYLERAGLVPAPLPDGLRPKVEHVVAAAADRIKTAGDVLDFAYFFLPDDRLVYDEKALAKAFQKPEAADRLARFGRRLAEAEAFQAEALEHLAHRFVEDEQIKLGDIVHAVRVAVTGQAVGLGLFDSLAILGRQSCLTRIDGTLQRAATAGGLGNR